ncbi:MAG: fructose-6-phosphate aldolase [Candidatus Diapherotrites archaeon]|nr:fructose-6-phosphate aldolase [Candidatus Diapherotrites archaeon]
MKIFLDTAEIDEIKKYAFLLDGVTTNPTLIMKSGRNFREVINEICNIVDGPISAEAVSLDATGMFKEAQEYSSWHKNIVVKIPMTYEGLKAVKMCSETGIKTNVTLVFSANQALLAAKAGATFASPFIGRLDDIGHDGVHVVREIVEIFNNYGFKTEIIAASIRHPRHVLECAKAGAHIATIPPKVLEKMFGHALTDVGIKRFLEDWEKAKK